MSNPFGTGALSRRLDVRDYKIGLSQTPTAIPSVYMPTTSLPVKMQGKYGTCGAHAGSAFVSFANSQDLSPKYLWKRIKQTDGYSLNQGTDMTSIFKTLANGGDCHEALCPNELDSTIEAYSDPSVITAQMDDDAYPFGVDHYAFTDYPSMQQIKQAIYQNKVVIALVDCGDGWYTNAQGYGSWLEKDVCPLRLGRYDSGHFVLLWGYDEKYIYFRNSWSSAWGRGGDGYFDASYIPHVKEIGVALPSISKQQKLVNLYTKLVFTLKTLLASLTAQKAH